MEFKDAYFLLGDNISKYKGKLIGHKNTKDFYEVLNLYIGLKKPKTDDFRYIEKEGIDFMGGVDTKIYSLLKNKPCRLYVKLRNSENDQTKEIALDEMEKEFLVK